MSACFADTFFFLALLVDGDEAHPRAVEATRNLKGKLYTTTWVLTEVADGLAPRQTRRTFLSLLEFLRGNRQVVIVPTTDELYNRGVNLYADRSDKDWSLTDCISFVVMKEGGISDALSGDHHFEQAGFTALLK